MAIKTPIFSAAPARPVIIAGPCMAETEELLVQVVEPMLKLSKELDFDYIFKASFDKANRTSIDSYRGPGLETASAWFQNLRKRFGVRVLTDIHESSQVTAAAAACDVLQIPAFLCRQTDLIVAAVMSGRAVNIKKGQFMAPEGAAQLSKKVTAVCQREGLTPDFALTERGVTFGYGNLVVDMRSFPIMARSAAPIVFDITHSMQLPATGSAGSEVSGGQRQFALTLARAAAATGYLSGFFLEVHPEPSRAKSDAAVQLSIAQASTLLRQVIPLWHEARGWKKADAEFREN